MIKRGNNAQTSFRDCRIWKNVAKPLIICSLLIYSPPKFCWPVGFLVTLLSNGPCPIIIRFYSCAVLWCFLPLSLVSPKCRSLAYSFCPLCEFYLLFVLQNAEQLIFADNIKLSLRINDPSGPTDCLMLQTDLAGRSPLMSLLGGHFLIFLTIGNDQEYLQNNGICYFLHCFLVVIQLDIIVEIWNIY